MALLFSHLLHESNIQMLCLCFLFLLLLLIHGKKPKPTQVRKSRLNLPPSPLKLPVIGHLHLMSSLPYRSLKKHTDKHGPLMFLQLGNIPTLVVSSADMAREVFRTHDLAFSDRHVPIAAKKISYGCLDITFAPYGEYWRQIRKICILELLSPKRVQSFGFVRGEEIGRLVETISLSCNPSALINVTHLFHSLTNNILCRVAYGKSYGSDSTFLELIEEIAALLGGYFIADYFTSMGWLQVFTGLQERIKKNFQQVDDFLEQVISDHLDPSRPQPEHEDLVDTLLGIANKRATFEISLTRDQIKAILMDMYTAGSDTTGVTLEWTMAELMRNARVMKKAQAEVRGIVGSKGIVEESMVGQMRYVKLVVKEALRLHPLGPLLVPRTCREECKVHGYDIPKKTMVLVNVWAIGRDPKSWLNPEEFWPERFLDSSVDFRGHDFQFLPFGTGRRGCPGMSFANASIELALAQLLNSFDWEFPAGMSMEELDMSESFGLVMRKKTALHLVATPHNPRNMNSSGT